MFFSESYGHIVNILKVNDHVVFVIKQFLELYDVFSYPCKSSRVGMVFAKSSSDRLVTAHVTEVSKCWSVKWSGDKYYFSRLLHASF